MAALLASAGASATSANPLGSAIASALMQFGTTSAPSTASVAASTTAITAASSTGGVSRSADTAGTTTDWSSTSGASKAYPALFAQLLAAAQQAADTDTASTGIGDGSAGTNTVASTGVTTGLVNAAATSSAPFASLSRQLQGSQQIQQYRNMASPFSNLAEALSSSSSTASSNSSGDSGFTAVFQNLWTSLSSSAATSSDAARSTIPSLPSFLQTLARNFSESGISGLHGVFVDTVV